MSSTSFEVKVLQGMALLQSSHIMNLADSVLIDGQSQISQVPDHMPRQPCWQKACYHNGMKQRHEIETVP
jgi:hypothetical protein